MKLFELIGGLDLVNISGDLHRDVSHICFSSGQCRQGSLFVAVPGLKNEITKLWTEAKELNLIFNAIIIKLKGNK